jgi:hypothetical protein
VESKPVEPKPVEAKQPEPKDEKLQLMCSLEGCTSSKIILLKRSDPFEKVVAAVREKMNADVAITFKDEDGDEVDLDSEDTWELLLDMNLKKYKVTCKKL